MRRYNPGIIRCTMVGTARGEWVKYADARAELEHIAEAAAVFRQVAEGPRDSLFKEAGARLDAALTRAREGKH